MGDKIVALWHKVGYHLENQLEPDDSYSLATKIVGGTLAVGALGGAGYAYNEGYCTKEKLLGLKDTLLKRFRKDSGKGDSENGGTGKDDSENGGTRLTRKGDPGKKSRELNESQSDPSKILDGDVRTGSKNPERSTKPDRTKDAKKSKDPENPDQTKNNGHDQGDQKRPENPDDQVDKEEPKKPGCSVMNGLAGAASLVVGGAVGYVLSYVCPWLPIPYYGGYIAALIPTGLSCWYTYRYLSSCCGKKPENQQNNGDNAPDDNAGAAENTGGNFLANLWKTYKPYVIGGTSCAGLLAGGVLYYKYGSVSGGSDSSSISTEFMARSESSSTSESKSDIKTMVDRSLERNPLYTKEEEMRFIAKYGYRP